ncbi:plasminogen-binding N-terminal domain-containing protein [Helicobacter fennelliae]
MKKFIVASLCIAMHALMYAEALNSPIKITIDKIDTKSQTIQFLAPDLKVGETGIINHHFGDNYQGIIGIAQITHIDSAYASAKIINNKLLSQPYLPNPTIAVSKGDEIVFRLLNNQAFIIAPNLETYEKVRLENKEINFLNSDLMVAYLFDKGGFDPKPSFFNEVCQMYSVGLLYVITQNTLQILDCQSLIVLESKEFDTSAVTDAIAPFFSRIQYSSSGSLDASLKSKKSKHYFQYYQALVKEGMEFKTIKIKSK